SPAAGPSKGALVMANNPGRSLVRTQGKAPRRSSRRAEELGKIPGFRNPHGGALCILKEKRDGGFARWRKLRPVPISSDARRRPSRHARPLRDPTSWIAPETSPSTTHPGDARSTGAVSHGPLRIAPMRAKRLTAQQKQEISLALVTTQDLGIMTVSQSVQHV